MNGRVRLRLFGPALMACVLAIEAYFRTYPGIGHGTNRRINGEVADFFRADLLAESLRSAAR